MMQAAQGQQYGKTTTRYGSYFDFIAPVCRFFDKILLKSKAKEREKARKKARKKEVLNLLSYRCKYLSCYFKYNGSVNYDNSYCYL
jgi:hypothetical protein